MELYGIWSSTQSSVINSQNVDVTEPSNDVSQPADLPGSIVVVRMDSVENELPTDKEASVGDVSILSPVVNENQN